MLLLDSRAIRDWCRQSFQSKSDMLKTKDAVKHNNEEGKYADALVSKEIINDVEGIKNPIFTQSGTRINILSGESIQTAFGKISKWFADLKTVAFTGKYIDLTGRPEIPAAVRVKGESETEYRTGDVNLTAGDIGALPVSGGILSSENGKILTLKRKNQTGGIEVLFSNEAKEIMSLLVNLLEQNGQFTLYDRIIESDIFSVSAKKRKIYDYKTDELKEILVEGEALPVTGGTLTKDGRDIITFNNLGTKEGIQGSDVVLHFNNQGDEYSQIVMRKTDDGVMFMIWDTLNTTKDIFHVTQKEITYKGKKILVEGEALPVSGGTIESSVFPILKLKSVGGNKIAAFDLIPEQEKEIKLRIQSGYDTGKGNASFDFFEINDGNVQQLCTLTKNGCKVFDPASSTLKKIITEGDTAQLVADIAYLAMESGVDIYE